MISSAISADLGRQDLVRGSSEALATVTGIVDGTGSIGAAVGQVRLQRKTSNGNEAEGLLWLQMLAHSSVHGVWGVCVYVWYLFNKQPWECVLWSSGWSLTKNQTKYF